MSETKPQGAAPIPESGVAPTAAAPTTRGGSAVLYGAGALLVLLALMLTVVVVWNRITVARLEQALVTQRTGLEQERDKALSVQGGEMLRLSGLPLGWAVRAEVLKDNLQQVDDYFRRFVREPGVERLLYVDAKGVVLVATDRKLESQSALGLVSASQLETAEPFIEETPQGLRLAVPIMAFEARAGLLLIDYSIATPEAASPAAAPAADR